jgi:hypothetical protein
MMDLRTCHTAALRAPDLGTPTSPPLDLSAPLGCDWRGGDVW